MRFLTPKEPSTLQDDLFDYSSIVNGNIQEFERFNYYFYTPTFATIARFSGLKDAEVIKLLTEIVFLKVFMNKHHFIEINPSVYLFQTAMRVVLRYLSNRDQHERVRAIEDVLEQENILRSIAKNNQDAKPAPPIK